MTRQPRPFLRGLVSGSLALAALHAWGVVIDSPAAVSQQVSEFNATLPPPDLRSLAVESGNGRPSAKDRLKAGDSGAARSARPSKFSNDATCPYLTKPEVRADGGGLNRHALGSTVCHEGKTYSCTEQGWSIRDVCISSLPTAQEVERSRFNTQVNEPPQDDDSEGGGGRSAGRNTSNQNGGGPTLMGQSPSGQRLREAQAEQRHKEQNLWQQQQQLQQLQQQQGAGVGPGNAYSGAGGNEARGNAQACESMRTELSAVERKLADVERFARASTTDGSINSRFAPEVNQYRTIRSQMQAHMRSQGCY